MHTSADRVVIERRKGGSVLLAVTCALVAGSTPAAAVECGQIHGTIDSFDNGVELLGVTGNWIEALVVDGEGAGSAVLLVESTQNRIRGSHLDCGCDAVITPIDSRRNRL